MVALGLDVAKKLPWFFKKLFFHDTRWVLTKYHGKNRAGGLYEKCDTHPWGVMLFIKPAEFLC